MDKLWNWTYVPSPVVKAPNREVGLAELHWTGATNPKWLTANVKNEMKQPVSSNSPWDWGGAVIAKPWLPIWEVKQVGHISQRCMSSWLIPWPKVKVQSKSIDARQQLCQYSYLSHVSQWLSQWLRKHETHDSPHATQQLHLWSVQQKTHDASHTSQIFQYGLRVPHSTSTMRHHLQGQVVPTST